MVKRIAMWSGPRNLSTAMMYAFGNRSDCAASDEPFYGPFLKLTGLDHPMRDEILATHDCNGDDVARAMVGPVPDGHPIWYQKHMCHHMVPGVPRDWMADVTHVFLIRHPARVIASYTAKRESPTADDIGFKAQAALFQHVRALGQTPIVIDSNDIRQSPKAALTVLCDALGIPFDPAMLSWEAGPKPADGVWAAHWYDAVHRSTGFAGAEGPLPELTGDAADLANISMADYTLLRDQAVKVL